MTTAPEPPPRRTAGNRPLLVPAARLSLNWLVLAAGIAVAVWALVQVRLVVLPALVALLVAALLLPAVDALRRVDLPSALATLTVMLVTAGLLAGLVGLVGPAFARELDDVGRSARQGLDEVIRWLTQGPLGLERAQIDRAVDSALDRLRGEGGRIASGVVAGAALVAELVAGFLLAVVLAFFFLHDGRRMWGWVVSLFPHSRRADVDAVGERVAATLTGYVRGVTVIAVVDAVLIGIALAVIGVPLVLPLMAVTFLGAFVPLVGAVLAGAVAALVALVTEGVLAAVLVVVAVTVIQQVEGDLLYPLVVGRTVQLHPVTILLVLTAGSVLAGVLGALIAVPVAAACWAGISVLRERRAAT